MLLRLAIVSTLLVPLLHQSNAASPESTPIERHYEEGESLMYHMKASNQGRTSTVHYEANAQGTVTKAADGHFVEQFRWSDLIFNGQAIPTAENASDFRQQLSLDPAISPSLPDFSHINPLLIGPCADLLTFYADLWLATKQGTLVRSGDRVYVKHGTPNSWADGNRTLLGQDSIDFEIVLSELNIDAGTAKLVVRHVPPKQPQIRFPAKWMETPVADTLNNWVEVTKSDSGNTSGRPVKRHLMLRSS